MRRRQRWRPGRLRRGLPRAGSYRRDMRFDANGIFIPGRVPLINAPLYEAMRRRRPRGRNMEIRAHRGLRRAAGARGGVARIRVGRRGACRWRGRRAIPRPDSASRQLRGGGIPGTAQGGWTGLAQAANGGRLGRSSGARRRRLTRDNYCYRESNGQFQRFRPAARSPAVTTPRILGRAATQFNPLVRRVFLPHGVPVLRPLAPPVPRCPPARRAARLTRDNILSENRPWHDSCRANVGDTADVRRRRVRPIIRHRAPTRDAEDARAAPPRFAGRAAPRRSG